MIKKWSLLGVLLLAMLLVPTFAERSADNSQDILAIKGVAVVSDDTVEVTFTSHLTAFNADQVSFYIEGLESALTPIDVNLSLTNEGETMVSYTFAKDSQFKGFDSDTDGSKLSVKLNVASSLIIDKMAPQLVSAEYTGKEAYLTFDEALAPECLNPAMISLDDNTIVSVRVDGSEVTVTCSDDIVEGAWMTIQQGAVCDTKGNVADEIEVEVMGE